MRDSKPATTDHARAVVISSADFRQRHVPPFTALSDRAKALEALAKLRSVPPDPDPWGEAIDEEKARMQAEPPLTIGVSDAALAACWVLLVMFAVLGLLIITGLVMERAS